MVLRSRQPCPGRARRHRLTEIRHVVQRYPRTPYWRLMIAPDMLFMLAFLWAFWAFGGFESSGLSGWALLGMLPMMTPMIILGRRRWADHAPEDRPGNEPRPCG